MTHQLTISFEVHRFENNPISQAHLDANRHLFAADVFEVLKRFVAGERWSYKSALNSGLSGDIRARVHDLKLMKIPVSSEWINTEKGRKYKEYFMTESDKVYALEVVLSILKKSERK